MTIADCREEIQRRTPAGSSLIMELWRFGEDDSVQYLSRFSNMTPVDPITSFLISFAQTNPKD